MQLAHLHPQDVEYFRQTLGEYAFEQALALAQQYREPIVKVLKAAVRNIDKPRLKSRFDRLTSGFGEEGEPSTIPRGNKRDIEGNIIPKQLDFGENIIMSDNVNFSRSTMKIGRSKKRSANDVFKAQIGQMKEFVFRWQHASNSLLGPGSIPISFGHGTENVQNQLLPFHIMSLTTHPTFAADNTLGCHDQGMARVVYRAPFSGFAGDIGYNWVNSENAQGGFGAGSWQYEKGLVNLTTSDVFHKWTDIRLNLYGSLSYPMVYNVMIVTGMPREMQLFENLKVSNTVNSAAASSDFPVKNQSPLNEFIIDKVRPLLTNPIKGSNSNDTYKGKFRIMANRTIRIPCLTYGDASAVGAGVVQSTNVKNLNIFLRHDRFRDYAWHARATDETKALELSNNSWTQTDQSSTAANSLLCDVDREERVFLIITCNAPQLTQDNDRYNILVQPDLPATPALKVEGSYDIVVRNCFRDGSET